LCSSVFNYLVARVGKKLQEQWLVRDCAAVLSRSFTGELEETLLCGENQLKIFFHKILQVKF
jgi:hypothetical protein